MQNMNSELRTLFFFSGLKLEAILHSKKVLIYKGGEDPNLILTGSERDLIPAVPMCGEDLNRI